MFVLVNLGALIFAANLRLVMEMPNRNIHKKGFSPEPPEGCDLSRERILLHCCCAPCSTAIIEWMVSEGLRPGIFFSNSNIVPFREYSIRRDELCRYAAAHGLKTVDDEYDHSAWLAFVRRLETPRSAESAALTINPSTSVAEPVEAPRMTENCAMIKEPLQQAQGPKTNAQGPAIRIADMPERGPRCMECFRFRLLRAARYAATHGYTLLTTTLASSRWKDLEQVDAAGRWACETINSSLVPPDNELLSTPCAGTVSDKVQTDLIPEILDKEVRREFRYAMGPIAVDREPSSRNQVSIVRWWNQNWRRGGLQERRNALIKEWDMYNQTFCGCEFSERH